MKLEVWRESIQLLKVANDIVTDRKDLDLRLKSRILSSAQSVSANLAEGYFRKSINEYLQFLSIALGSLGEVLTKMVGLHECNYISADSLNRLTHFTTQSKTYSLLS